MRSILLLVCLWTGSATALFAQVSVVNAKGTRIDVDSSKWTLSTTHISNKNTGNVGIGNTNPSYKLDVTGKLRVTDSLLTNSARITGLGSGSVSDSLLVADPTTGIVKRISASQLNRPDSTTADNGLTLSGNNVQLGGNLVQTTTITNNTFPLTIATGGTALNITGLSAGALTDSILTINASTGKVNRINSSLLATRTAIVKTADQTSTSTTVANITDLAFAVTNGSRYNVNCHLLYTSAATGTGIRIGVTAPAGTVALNVETKNAADGTAANFEGALTASGDVVVSTATPVAATVFAGSINGLVLPTANGTVQFTFGSEVAASAVVIRAGSVCFIEPY